MILSKAVDSRSIKLRRFYEALNEMSITAKLLLSIVMALSIGALAQVRVFVPWTPVPIVLTQLGVVTYASVMGRKWGVFPTLLYVAGGVAGIPWFSSYGGGLPYLLGPTGGYLLGFILSAWIVSNLTNSKAIKGKAIRLIGVVLFTQLVLIYLPGLFQLNQWLTAASGQTVGFNNLLVMGFYPFVIGDILKSIIAALIIFNIGRK